MLDVGQVRLMLSLALAVNVFAVVAEVSASVPVTLAPCETKALDLLNDFNNFSLSTCTTRQSIEVALGFFPIVRVVPAGGVKDQPIYTRELCRKQLQRRHQYSIAPVRAASPVAGMNDCFAAMTAGVR